MDSIIPTPSHIIIKKSEDFTLNDLDTVADSIKEVQKEFQVLENFVENHISKKVGDDNEQ